MSMNLELNPRLAVKYKSLSQKARVMTESWVSENLYCPACFADSLESLRAGKKVTDFTCSGCDENFQLKSKSHSFGRSVVNSAYAPKIKAIRSGRNPNYLFLQYSLSDYCVHELFLVPRYFMTPSLVEERRPLNSTARRSGWIGSNILLGNLPLEARIGIVASGVEIPKNTVRAEWNRFLFLRDQSISSRGWLSDILKTVRMLNNKIFTLEDVYTFESDLAVLHPHNKHIRPKIRQQLQLLRNKGVVEFLGRGRYRLKD